MSYKGQNVPQVRDPSPEYYFGDAYRKFAHHHHSSSNNSSGPGSPSTSSNGNGSSAYVFGSLFVSADSHTPYTDATQVCKQIDLIT